MHGSRTRILVEMALTIGLAWVLGRLVVYRLPNGGTVSLNMLPLFVFALRRGLLPGLAAGALYGVLDYTLDPYFVHWAQVLLDYPLAYMAVGVAGVMSGPWRRAVEAGRQARGLWTAALPGIVIGAVLRFVMHFASGIIFFGSYAPAGQPVALYSLLYNGTYLLPSAVLCAVAAAAILPTLEKAVPAR